MIGFDVADVVASFLSPRLLFVVSLGCVAPGCVQWKMTSAFEGGWLKKNEAGNGKSWFSVGIKRVFAVANYASGRN